MKIDTERILNYLKELFPQATSELNFRSPYELLVAVILSAQCTDKRVNLVTPSVFLKYPTVQDLADANLEELQLLISSCNYYKTKAKNLILASNSIVKNFKCSVPNKVEDLMTLAGVGKKTANVIYSVAYLGQAIAVDTHVLRVSNRLNLSNSNNPLVVEQDLMVLFDKNIWTELHYMLVLFGRHYCLSRNPKCEECKLKDICLFFKENKK